MINTTLDEIARYWSLHQSETGLSVDWAEARERYWRCGYKSKLQRCHIIPHSLGGADEAANLVLLCLRCHREAPNVSDPSYMWLWLRSHAVPFYDTYWTLRAVEEFEKLHQRKPFSLIDSNGLEVETLTRLINSYVRQVCVHFGEVRLNPSTLAWIILQIETSLRGKNGTPELDG
jgi:hypothetical protein